MKKNIKKNSVKILKTIDENNLGSIARVILSSFVLILFFYSLPLIIKFTDEKILNTKEFKNNSKVILAYTLDKENNENSNEIYDENDLLVDIYSLNEKETDTVRLDASTIKQYEDTNYKLDDIRKNKLVKPIAPLLPLKLVENTRKERAVYQIVLPLILKIIIKLDRETFGIINKSNNTDVEKNGLIKIQTIWNNIKRFINFKIRMDEIPVSLALVRLLRLDGELEICSGGKCFIWSVDLVWGRVET